MVLTDHVRILKGPEREGTKNILRMGVGGYLENYKNLLAYVRNQQDMSESFVNHLQLS